MFDRFQTGFRDRAGYAVDYPHNSVRSVLWDIDFTEATTPFTLTGGALSGTAGAPGYYRLITAAVAATSAAVGNVNAMTIDANCIYRFGARLRHVNLSTAVEQYITRIGYGDSAVADFTDGIYFELDSFVNGNVSLKTAAAGVRTTVTGTIAPTANTFYDVMFRATSTSVSGFVNGALIGTITTNIPTGANLFGFATNQVKIAGATNRESHIDHVWSTIDFLVPRGINYGSY